MQSGAVPTGTWLSPRSLRWRRWISRLAVVVILYALHPLLFSIAGRWLNVGEPLNAPVDYAFILGGDVATRPFQAAAIYRAGYARKVLISNISPSADAAEGLIPTEQMLQREILQKRGVPEGDIISLARTVNSTRDEADALKEFLDEHPTATVAVVTSDFHTRRTRMIFRRRLPQFRDQIRFVATPTDGFGSDSWWHFKDGVLWYGSEYIKLARDFLTAG